MGGRTPLSARNFMRIPSRFPFSFVAATCLLAACGSPGQEQQAATGADEQKSASPDQAPDYVVRTTSSNGVDTPDRLQGPAGGSVAPRNLPLLPEERKLIVGGTISVDAVGRMIRTPDFDKFMRQLSIESAHDPLALDVTKVQRSYLENNLKEVGALRDFACGLSVCAGIVSGGKDIEPFNRFREHFLSDPSAAAYSLLNYPMTLDNGEIEIRLVMSADPTVDGISTSARPFPTR